MEVFFRLNNAPEAELLLLESVSAKKTSVTRLKALLIERFADLTYSKSAFQWNISINNRLINDFEAASVKVSAFGEHPQVHLQYKQAKSSRKRRANEEEDAPVQDLIQKIQRTTDAAQKYSLTEKLLSLLRDPSLFRAEQEHNGMQVTQIFRFFQLIKANIGSVMERRLRVFVQTDPAQIFPNVSTDVVLRPFFAPGHVSLLCHYSKNRILHLDPSGSPLSMKNVEKTFLNYQIFDQSSQIKGGEALAGGNCAIFTCVNAIRCILEHFKYATMEASFEQFWQRVQSVARKSEADISPLLLDLFMRMLDKREIPFPPGMPVGMLMAILPKFFRALPPRDYLPDIIMLDLFLQTNVGGFENVSLLGNVGRLYLKDLASSGGKFISNSITNQQRQKAGAVQLSAWILTRHIMPSPEEVETLEEYMFEYLNPDMEVGTFESLFGGDAMTMAERILQHYFKDNTTFGQNLARKYLQEKESRMRGSPVVKANQLDARYQPELPIPKEAILVPGVGLPVFDKAVVSDNLYQRLIRVPGELFERTLAYDSVLVILHNVKTNVATMARIEGPAAEGDAPFQVSTLVAESLEQLQGPIALHLYYNVPAPQYVEFHQIEGDSANLREALEVRLNHSPGLVAGEVLQLPAARVQVKELNTEGEPVRFVTIKTGDINFKVQPMCANCAQPVASNVCDGCGNAFYCGEACHQEHWKQHKERCYY